MSLSTRVNKALLVLAGLLLVSSSLAESPDGVQPDVESDFDLTQYAPDRTVIRFSVVVFDNVGWSESEVRHVLDEAKSIYARECRVELAPTYIQFVDIDYELRKLSQYQQEQVLDQLDNIERPVVLFIDETTELDYAYAYLEGTESPSQGTAWLTRQARAECRGPMLAHELGHIALRADKHSGIPDNLMNFSCRHSNISNQLVNTDLTRQQCEILWKRYSQPLQ